MARGGVLIKGASKGAYEVTGTGTSGQVLTSNGAGADPTFQAPSGGPGGSFVGAMVKKSADETGANYTTATAVAWNTEVYDTDAFHDTVTNNSRLTIPSGVSKVNVRATIRVNNVTGNTLTQVAIRKNGSADYDGAASQDTSNANTTRDITVCGLAIPVTPGDYFEAYLFQITDTAIDVVAARSSFSIQQVE
jgi:hypothetical protein